MYDFLLIFTTVSKIHFPVCSFAAHLAVREENEKLNVPGSFDFKLLLTSS